MPPSGIASRAFTHRFSDGQLDLAGVDLDRPEPGAELHLDLDVAAAAIASSIARMPVRCAARSIDSGFTGRRRENASRCRVSPVPRATARRIAVEHALALRRRPVALEQLHAAGEHREQVVEVVRDAAGQLAERLHLLRLPKRLLRRAQPLLVAQPLGHVVDELVGADALAARGRAAC